MSPAAAPHDTALPERDAYYRPTLSRGLRRKAEVLEWWSRHLVAGLWFVALARPPDPLARVAARCRAEAEALEREHRNRYSPPLKRPWYEPR